MLTLVNSITYTSLSWWYRHRLFPGREKIKGFKKENILEENCVKVTQKTIRLSLWKHETFYFISSIWNSVAYTRSLGCETFYVLLMKEIFMLVKFHWNRHDKVENEISFSGKLRNRNKMRALASLCGAWWRKVAKCIKAIGHDGNRAISLRKSALFEAKIYQKLPLLFKSEFFTCRFEK